MIKKHIFALIPALAVSGISFYLFSTMNRQDQIPEINNAIEKQSVTSGKAGSDCIHGWVAIANNNQCFANPTESTISPPTATYLASIGPNKVSEPLSSMECAQYWSLESTEKGGSTLIYHGLPIQVRWVCPINARGEL
jgi:hypothetical protein